MAFRSDKLMGRCTKRLTSKLDSGKDENTAIELCTANISDSEVQDTENSW